MLTENYKNIPREMKQLNQWVLWGTDKNNLKCPYNPTSLQKAKADDPANMVFVLRGK